MLDALILRAIGPILTAVGSIALAFRLEAIIDAILLGLDANQKGVLRLLEGEEAKSLEASHNHVLRELRRAKTILWWGFALVALGGIVNALSYFIN
jgi:hypothetical protein